MISFSLGGSTSKTSAFLNSMKSQDLTSSLDQLARRGVEALSAATPVESGATAAAWDYVIESTGDKTTISWTNSNSNEGANVAILLQYGHGTGTGGYVSGRDYINPAIKPVFDEIANELWKRVTNA